MINLTDITIIKSQMKKHITDEDLKNYKSEVIELSCQLQSIDFPRLLCHTQVVKKFRNIVIESSLSVRGSETRGSFVKVKVLCIR